MDRALSFFVGYILGSIQFAFIIGKIYGIDIRKHGSGNAGMTNVTRVLGAKYGIFVFIFDILKGLIAFNLCKFFIGQTGDFLLICGMYGGLGAIIGHDFPFYLKFKGGKGTATTLGFLLFINPKIAIITYIVGFLVASITKYISLASLIITFIFPIFMIIEKMDIESVIIMVIVMILCYYQHRGNIKRLIKKEERKFSFKRNKE